MAVTFSQTFPYLTFTLLHGSALAGMFTKLRRALYFNNFQARIYIPAYTEGISFRRVALCYVF